MEKHLEMRSDISTYAVYGLVSNIRTLYSSSLLIPIVELPFPLSLKRSR